MVQPRSPVANMPRSEDMQLTTVCHEFSCGCTAPQSEPEQSKEPAPHQHPEDFPVSSAKRNPPLACMCIYHLFLRLQEENSFLHKLPLLAKSPALVRVAVAGNAVLSVKDMAPVNQTRALATWGTCPPAPPNAKNPCPVEETASSPVSVMSGGRKCLPKMAFCCLP